MTSIPAHWLAPSPVRAPAQAAAPPAGDSANIDPALMLLSSSPTQTSSQPASTDDVFGPALPASALQNRRKRPAEDFSQYADHVSRKLRLNTEGHEELKDFSQLTGPQQSIWIAGRILGCNAQLLAIAPAETVYKIPTLLEGHIDKACFLALVEHTAPNYVSKTHGPTTRVINFLAKHPSWGLSQAVRDDKAKFTVIADRIRDKLTHCRNLIKVTIEASMGVVSEVDPLVNEEAIDIVTLCQRIVAIGSKVASDIKVSLEMAARVAYLRFHYQQMIDGGKPKAPEYWKAVDSGLAAVRETTKGDAVLLSRVFTRVLTDDVSRYGDADLDGLMAVPAAVLA